MFVRGGFVTPGSYLNYAANEGDYWSSVSYYSYYAYRLGFYSGGISPTGTSDSLSAVSPSAARNNI